MYFHAITQLSAGPAVIQTWGLFAALGFVAALWISLREARRKYIDAEIILDVMIISLVGMVVGGRILYFLSSSRGGADVLLNAHGGFSLLGGAVAAGALSMAYLKIKEQDIRRVFDALAPGIAASLIFVRIGCFLVNDHIGRKTELPWGISFSDGLLRHPVALYHIFFLLAIFFIIFRLKSKQTKDGLLFFDFCVFYAALAFIADLFRCSDLPVCDAHLGSFTLSQWALLVFLFLSPLAGRFFVSSQASQKTCKKSKTLLY